MPNSLNNIAKSTFMIKWLSHFSYNNGGDTKIYETVKLWWMAYKVTLFVIEMACLYFHFCATIKWHQNLCRGTKYYGLSAIITDN